MTEAPIIETSPLDWFLYNRDLRHERVKKERLIFLLQTNSQSSSNYVNDINDIKTFFIQCSLFDAPENIRKPLVF